MAEIDKLRDLKGLASMSAKAATVLFRFALEADPLGAGTDARMMGKEMSSLTSILTHLVSVLSTEEKSHSSHCLRLVDRMNMRMLDIFADILDYPTYPRQLNPIRVGNLFRWAFDEPEMRLLRATIESYRITLSLLVATVEQSRKPSSCRQPGKKLSGLDEEEIEHRAILAGLTHAQKASYRELCEIEQEVNVYGHPGMSRIVHESLGAGSAASHPLGSQSLIELLQQTGLELQALKSRWYGCSSTTEDQVHAEPLAEKRTSSLLADLNVRISALRMALNAISIMKASTRNLVHFRRTLGTYSRLFPLSSSPRDAHLQSLRTAEFELNGISEDWVDLSFNAGHADANIVPFLLGGKCQHGHLMLPCDHGEVDKAEVQCSDTTLTQSDREVERQMGGNTPAQEQRELEDSPKAALEKTSIFQEALKAARAEVCLDSATEFMKAIEKFEESSQLLEELEDIFKITEDGKELQGLHSTCISHIQELRMKLNEATEIEQGR